MGNPENFSPEEETNPEREINPDNIFDLNYVYYLQELGRPIEAADLGGKTIVIDSAQFGEIGYLDIKNSQGELIAIDLIDNISDQPLIIKPEDLFNENKEEQKKTV